MDEIVVRLDQHQRWLSQSEDLTAQELGFIDEDLASDSLREKGTDLFVGKGADLFNC